MQDLAFRSCDPMSQGEFVRWLHTVPAGDLHHYELLDGFIVMEPPAGWPHGHIEALVVGRLYAFLGSNPAGRLFGSSQGFNLPTGDTVEPDIAFVSDERWRELAQPVRGFPRVVPDLVVEILSPSAGSGGGDPLPEHQEDRREAEEGDLRAQRSSGVLADRCGIQELAPAGFDGAQLR